MKKTDIVHQRLRNQHLASSVFDRAGDVVRWFGAVQAQDYPAALWAVGLRARDATAGDIEKALADRTIVRTWPMRRTLHFVAAEDIRWMLKLLASRNAANMTAYYRQLGLDEATFSRSRKVLSRALEGGRQLTRQAMYRALEAGRISTADQRGLHIMCQLAQEGFICFGAREGKQQTFALLDEWVPNAKTLERDEALVEIARRYFTSHGPATLQDFVWWSGLRVGDAKSAIEMAKEHLAQEVIEGQTYWLASSIAAKKTKSPIAHLLPVYDEYTVAYKDRSAALDPLYMERARNGIFGPQIMLNGKIIGTWKQALKKDKLVITPDFFVKPNETDTRAIAKAADRYGKFIGASIVLA